MARQSPPSIHAWPDIATERRAHLKGARSCCSAVRPRVHLYRFPTVGASKMAKQRIRKVGKQLRILEMMSRLVDGYSYSECMRYGSQAWAITERQAKKYIKHAREQLDAQDMAARLCSMRWHVYKRLELLERAEAAKDHGACLRILDNLARLQGHQPEKELKVTLMGTDEARDIDVVLDTLTEEQIIALATTVLH